MVLKINLSKSVLGNAMLLFGGYQPLLHLRTMKFF